MDFASLLQFSIGIFLIHFRGDLMLTGSGRPRPLAVGLHRLVGNKLLDAWPLKEERLLFGEENDKGKKG
jgi:hypothetical protein